MTDGGAGYEALVGRHVKNYRKVPTDVKILIVLLLLSAPARATKRNEKPHSRYPPAQTTWDFTSKSTTYLL